MREQILQKEGGKKKKKNKNNCEMEKERDEKNKKRMKGKETVHDTPGENIFCFE